MDITQKPQEQKEQPISQLLFLKNLSLIKLMHFV